EIRMSGYSYLAPFSVENSGRIEVSSGEADLRLVKNTGTVDVLLGAELYANGFTSNEGTLNVNGTLWAGTIACGECGFALPEGLTNEAGGLITGTGTVVVGGGTGVLENDGKIAPGGVGSTGKLTIDGHLQMNAGSVLHVDLVNRLTHDILQVTGTAVTGGTVEVGHPAGTSIAAGDTFAVLRAASLASDTLPGVGSGQVVAGASGSDLVLRATAPLPATGGSGVPQGGAQQQVLGEIITFQQLFEQAANGDDEQRIGKDDIVVTDVACTPR
ncbi:MAG TPA: hypothetical protein VEB23_09095, partial [Ramlibacter sp.]|nr:hypothetical protein [Ramlibacter sp.]